MIGRIVLAGFLLALGIWSSPQSIAYDGEFLSSQKLQEAYRRFCLANINELRTLLRKKKTKVQGTKKLVVNTYNDRLNCDFQSDPLYKSMELPASIEKTENSIRKTGKEKYIEATKASIQGAREKYEIDLLLKHASSNIGLSEGGLKILIVFAKAKARAEAVILELSSAELDVQ